MTYYQSIIKQNQKIIDQLKCFAVFLWIIIPFCALAFLIQDYSMLLYQLILFFGGWFIWTFIEYNLHRFWMHDKKNAHSSIVKTHNHHHAHPTEIVVTALHRLVIILLMGLFIVTSYWLQNYFTLLAGIFCGLMGYFIMHKLLHLPIAQKIFQKLCRYHIYHHCKYHNACFGISVPWWDDIFGTVPQSPQITQKIIDFYFKDHHH